MEKFRKHLEKNESIYVTVIEAIGIGFVFYICVDMIGEFNEMFLNGKYYESYMGAIALIYFILFSIVLIFGMKKIFRVVDYFKAKKSESLTKTTV